MRARLIGPILAATCLALAPDAQDMERAKKLFLTNCAACHGETGDGKGTTQLDRPARSFQDGGFSFGNTPEALFKTISTGIPGSPMAGFDSSLSEEERRLVASYVVTLGPPITEVSEEEMILAVHDRPLIVRGLLPSLGEGLAQTPRGLLIGDPSGITFEYRVDDVRLLALRQGGFVKRTDWTGRGGTPLEPLGKVVQLVEGGKPEPLFTLGMGTIPLAVRLAGTRIDGDHAVVDYHLLGGSGEVAHVAETPHVVARKLGTGYGRTFTLTGGVHGAHLSLRDPTQDRDWSFTKEDRDGIMAAGLDDGATEYVQLVLKAQCFARRKGMLVIELTSGESATLELNVLPSSTWSETQRPEGLAR